MPKIEPVPRAARPKAAAAPPLEGPSRPAEGDEQLDVREQTYNDGLRGQIERVSTAVALIVRVRAVMVDVDPKYLASELYAGEDGTAADRLYTQTAHVWLNRHPLLRHAEVRHSGTGLHVVQHVGPAVEFQTTADRDRWAAIVRAVQASLPGDPNAPGLNVHTRPLGSINSKSGLPVKLLRKGSPVSPKAVIDFVEDLRRRPFATVAGILFGTGRITPCPVCRSSGSSMAAMANEGRCYERCGKVTLARLYGTIMADPTAGRG